MTTRPRSLLIFSAAVILAAVIPSLALPISYSEVSLLVRARETESSIQREVNQRKLARALSPQEEATLKSQGASDSLVQGLRNPKLISTQPAPAPAAVKPGTAPMPQIQEAGSESAAENLQVFEVSCGHPINLSQWGGPDSEFAFNVYRYAGENIVEPVLVDTVRSYADIATYIGVFPSAPPTTQPTFHRERFTPYLNGDLKDDTYMIGGYVTGVSHSVSRSMTIDRKNAVFIKGVPYTLYPIYGARGVSLYYIGSSSDTVKLAVKTTGR